MNIDELQTSNEKTGSVENPELPSEEKDVTGKDQSHIEMQFHSGNYAKFYCRVYFAEQFRVLRKRFIEGGEEFYIRSISRCASWAAKGGKSGSKFCKTFGKIRI